eukprot:gene11842-8440_t
MSDDVKATNSDELLDTSFKAGFVHIYLLANKKKKAAASMSLSRILERVGVASAASSLAKSKASGGNSGGLSAAGSMTSKGSSQPSNKKLNQVAAAQDAAERGNGGGGAVELLAVAPASPAKASTRVAPVSIDDDDNDSVPTKLDAIQESAAVSRDDRDASHGPSAVPEVQAVWSGKVMDAASSQKFLKFITSGPPTSTRSSLLAAGSFKASAKRTLLGGRSSKTQDEALATVADADEAAAEDNVLAQLREEFPDQVVVLPVSVTAASQPV